MSYADLLNIGEILATVTQYEVHRQEGRIMIDCIEVLEGEAAAKFIAIPHLISRGRAQEEFYGLGTSAEGALRDCLGKIKDQPYEKICSIGGEAYK